MPPGLAGPLGGRSFSSVLIGRHSTTFRSKSMTKMNNLCKAALTLGFALLATAATAQTMGTASTDLWSGDFQKAFMTEKMMHMMDKGGKGMVTKAEFMAHMDKIFDMLDKDHNGMLEANEFIYEKALGV